MEINKSRPLFFIGVPNHLLSIVFAFHHHSQKVIGSLEFCTDIFRQFLKAKPKSFWSSYTGLCSVHRFVFVSTDKCDWVLFFWGAETMIYHAGITYSSCNYWKTYENPVVMYLAPCPQLTKSRVIIGHAIPDTGTPWHRNVQIAAAFDAVGQSGYVSLCGWTRGREVFAQGIQGFQEADGTRMSQEFKDQWLVNGI